MKNLLRELKQSLKTISDILVSMREIRKTLKNPLVRLSLILGIIGAPFLWYSGIFLGQGRELIGGVFFIVYTLIFTVDALITLTLILKR